MESKNSYFIAGLFFCVAFVCIAVFVLFMNISGKKDENRDYYIQTKELPRGVKKDTQVMFLGVPAGFVEKVYFSDQKSATIEIKMSIKKDLPISKDSTATVEIQGISGLSNINITKGSGVLFDPNEKAIIKMGEGLLDKIGSSAKNIGDRLEHNLKKIDDILNEENAKKLSVAVQNIGDFANKIANEKNANNVNEILSNLVQASQNMKKIDFNELSKSLNTLLANTNQTILGFNKLQDNLNKKIELGEYDFKQTLSTPIDNLNQTLLDLKTLINEINNALFRLEDNPYEFFFKDASGEKK